MPPSIQLGSTDQIAIERDYWTAYKEARHRYPPGDLLASLFVGLLSFPAGLVLWIFFIGLYGSRSKDSCSHFLLPIVTRDVPQISEFLEMATQVGVFTSMCNWEFPYRKASKTPIVDN